jgi:hypothetical protein
MVRIPIEQRIAEKILRIPFSDCWFWVAASDRNGYGVIRNHRGPGGRQYVHRVMYQRAHGDTHGLHVCHRCDNPACVNPDHLFLGTDYDNHADKARKGRAGKKLTTSQAQRIRELCRSGTARKEVAKQFGISTTMVGYIDRDMYWKGERHGQ